jgi:hypothetical protein
MRTLKSNGLHQCHPAKSDKGFSSINAIQEIRQSNSFWKLMRMFEINAIQEIQREMTLLMRELADLRRKRE